MKQVFKHVAITTIRSIRGKIDSTDYTTIQTEKTFDEIIRITKENKFYYVIDIPDEEIRVVKVEKYPCVFEDLKGNQKTKIIKQETMYVFS